MNLEKLFDIYLEQAKKQAITLSDIERTRVCQWIKKIELASNNQENNDIKKLQINSLKLLLLTIESNCLVGPFEETPVDDKKFTEYNWDSYQLEDFSNMIRAKGDACNRPEVSYAASANRQELVTYQNDPSTGQHCYYACSRQPIEKWNNLQGGAIKNQSIANWEERAEFAELNDKESESSSIDNPRCVMQPMNSEVDLNDEQFPNSSQFQRVQNSSNYNENPSGPSRRYDRIHTCRPETPQRFGGRGETKRPYEMEQFGLSHNEQFRSPRGVFQNLDYDRFQSQRSPIPPRLTDEVIESFEKARLNRGPLSEVEEDDARRQLCARLQKIRDEMNKKPQIEIEDQIEVEPEEIPFERITLQEPLEDITHHHDETEQDLGILSPGEMDDDDLFNEHQTIDPRTVFKTRDENLVSRNVLKIETNTTINGSKREVTEEILEQEDLNVVESADKDDENLADVSEPTFESSVGRLPEQWKCKPRRVLTDYSDLPQENLGDISKPSFEQESFYQEHECFPREQNEIYTGGQPPSASQRENLTGSERRSTRGFGSCFKEGYNSGRLENISEPVYASSFQNSDQRICAKGTHSNSRPMVQFETMHKLDEESPPDFETSFEDSRVTAGIDGGLQPCRRLPQVEESERLDEISQPSFLHSTEVSHKDSSQRSRYLTSQRPLPQVETSERLDEVSHPGFLSSIEESYQSSTRRNSCPLSKRDLPQIDTSERLDQVTYPSFNRSFQYSNVPSSKRRDFSSEFVPSTEEYYQDSLRRTRCPLNRMSFPQEKTSERLDNVSQPGFVSSFEDSTVRSRCPIIRRGMPQVDTSENLDEISKPSLNASFQGSTIPSRRERLESLHRCLLSVDASERLDDVSQPRFLHSTEASYQDSSKKSRSPTNQRHSAQLETSERLDNVSYPSFLNYEDTTQDSIARGRRAMPKVDESEELDQISQPSFGASIQNSTAPSRRGRFMSPHKTLPPVETSERLDDVSQPGFFNSTEVSVKNFSGRSRCPMNRRLLPQVETSERLDQVSQPSYLPSFIEKTNEDCRRRCKCQLSQRPLTQVELSEQLDQVSQPEYIASEGRSSFEDSFQKSKRQTQDRNLTHPFYPNSIRDRSQISRKNEHRSVEEYNTTSDQTPIDPLNNEESEILEAVTQPDLTTFEETGYESKDSWQTLPQRPLPQIEESEILDDMSQPYYQSSYKDSTLRPKLDSRHIEDKKRLPFVETSERLSNICQSDLFNTRQTQSMGYENLEDICQPSYQSTLEDSNQKENQSKHRYLPHLQLPFQESSLLSGGRKQTPRQRLLSRVDGSEVLDNVSQPFYPSSFEDSVCVRDRRQDSKHSRDTQPNSTSNRPFAQVNDSENLDNVTEPGFQSSFEDSRPTTTLRPKATQRIDRDKRYTQEELNDISQPKFPTSFEDSRRYIETPKRRPLPSIDTSEKIEYVSHPLFQSSFEESSDRSRRPEQIPMRIPFSQVNESEVLDDISHPSGFPCSLKDTTAFSRGSRQYPSQTSGSDRNNLGASKQSSVRQRPLNQIDNSERLNEISQPDFATTIESTIPRSICPSEQCRRRQQTYNESYVSERLDDVCQPSFPNSYDNSSRYSRRNESKQSREPIFRYGKQSDVSDRSDRKSRRPHIQFETSEMLEDITQPGYSSTFHGSSNVSRNAKRTDMGMGNRPMPQIELSENIESVCQPSLPSPFSNDSTRNEVQQLPSTYRKNKDYMTNFPRERVVDISAPQFDSTCEDCLQRPRRNLYLPHENLEDVSHPSFQTTPKTPSRQDYQCHRGPPRQLFPKEASTNREQIERPGDFRQVFKTMPNYAPFEEQVASKRNPIASKLKMPASLAPLTKCEELHKTQMVNPCRRPQPSQPNERPKEGDFHVGRIRPSNIKEAYPSSRNRKEPGPTASSTRIPPPPSARTQTNVQGQNIGSKTGRQPNQERLVKKSSVKFHQTKSTYFKNKQDQLNRNQRR